jgi:hypothetical protein
MRSDLYASRFGGATMARCPSTSSTFGMSPRSCSSRWNAISSPLHCGHDVGSVFPPPRKRSGPESPSCSTLAAGTSGGGRVASAELPRAARILGIPWARCAAWSADARSRTSASRAHRRVRCHGARRLDRYAPREVWRTTIRGWWTLATARRRLGRQNACPARSRRGSRRRRSTAT